MAKPAVLTVDEWAHVRGWTRRLAHSVISDYGVAYIGVIRAGRCGATARRILPEVVKLRQFFRGEEGKPA